MMTALPNIFAAAIILGIAYFVAALVSSLISNLLGGMGFNALPEKLGMGQAFTNESTPSQLVGRIASFFIMLFAAVEASNRLGFEQVSELVAMFIQFGSQVILGGIIITVGFWLSNLAAFGYHSCWDLLQPPTSHGLPSWVLSSPWDCELWDWPTIS